MRSRYLLILSTILCFFILVSCNTTEPVERKINNPLDMTWTYEILSPTDVRGQLVMRSIYASNSKDIWICGHNAENIMNLWHYDGIKWRYVDLLINGNHGSAYPWCLFGFSSTNIWLAGERNYYSGGVDKRIGLIMHFDGAQWIDQKLTTSYWLYAISADTPSNIWAGGESGIILHYDGINWSADTIKLKGADPKSYSITSIAVYNGKPVIIANENSFIRGINTFYITGELHNWKILDSMKVMQNGGYTVGGDWRLYKSKSNKLYSYGALGIWEWVNEKWNKVLSGNIWVGGLIGISDNYMIAVGSYSYASFFDGSTWSRIQQIQDIDEIVQFEDVWTDGTEVFIVGYSTGGFPNKTYIWHGKKTNSFFK